MIVKIKLLSTILLFSLFILNGQNLEKEKADISGKMDKTVCRIYIHQNFEGQTITFSGTGINIAKLVKNDTITFVFTANHVIENLLKLKDSYLKVYFTNTDGNIFSTGNLGVDNIIWRDRDMDAAIIGIPRKIHYNISLESNVNWVVSPLEHIGNGTIGQTVYMLGKRWISKENSISIYKKGIISAKIKGFPNYENITVYIIDKMGNKGMSGGLIFNDNFEGIALISSYVLEKEKKIQTSDDLTIGIPLLPLSQKLDSIIRENGDNIIQLLGY